MTSRRKRLLLILVVGVLALQVGPREAVQMWRCERNGTWPEMSKE